ncbi:hypothetical protein BH09BAC2_BH09BAC2_01020 [soil metagenome]
MKKIIGSVLALTLFAFSVNAQSNNQQQNQGQSGYHKGHGKMDGGMGDLNLSDAQKQQIKAINEDFKNKMKALKNNNSGADNSSQRLALIQERKSKISAVLTAEQRVKFEQKGDRGFMEDHGNCGGKMEELNLTEDQKARIKASNESFKPRMETIRNNQSLTEQQKGEQLQALQAERQMTIRSILTAEQAAKFDQMHPQGDFKGKMKGHDGKQKIKAGKGKNKNKIKTP